MLPIIHGCGWLRAICDGCGKHQPITLRREIFLPSKNATLVVAHYCNPCSATRQG